MYSLTHVSKDPMGLKGLHEVFLSTPVLCVTFALMRKGFFWFEFFASKELDQLWHNNIISLSVQVALSKAMPWAAFFPPLSPFFGFVLFCLFCFVL